MKIRGLLLATLLLTAVAVAGCDRGDKSTTQTTDFRGHGESAKAGSDNSVQAGGLKLMILHSEKELTEIVNSGQYDIITVKTHTIHYIDGSDGVNYAEVWYRPKPGQ